MEKIYTAKVNIGTDPITYAGQEVDITKLSEESLKIHLELGYIVETKAKKPTKKEVANGN